MTELTTTDTEATGAAGDFSPRPVRAPAFQSREQPATPPSRERMGEINALDLAFVVDTTGSMSSLIASAQRQMIGMIRELAQAEVVDVRLGIVEYRDHPPQDTMVFRVAPFTGDLKAASDTINGLQANGGGDTPEAVLDGLWAACYELAWRPHARRIAVLVGDAPPHGVGYSGDGFADGCPCGETIQSVTAALEEERMTLYAIGLRGDVTDSFGRLSAATGGAYFASGQGEAAIQQLRVILADEFGALGFDRRVLDVWSVEPTLALDTLAERLASSRPAISAAVSRLGARGLLG